MNIADLIVELQNPRCYPHPVSIVEVRQTHISAVFLVDSLVYKIKKPVSLGFLDFSTLEKRRQMCWNEVRLNRRLAPNVYLDVVPIAKSAAGLAIESPGEVVEWAVKMVRLPDNVTLQSRLLRGVVNKNDVEAIARRLELFHRQAETGPEMVLAGSFESVAGNARENFEQSIPQVGHTVSARVFDRVRFLTEQQLAQWKSLFEQRCRQGLIRDTHGDLHADHVYMFPEMAPPNDLLIIDCIEFNDRFRYADPVADMAFLAMDLKFHGFRDLAKAFSNAYLSAAHDVEGQHLLAFYTGYRAVVRAKVKGMALAEPEVPESEKRRAARKAQRYWLLAHGELEQPNLKPCLIAVGGLPGTGKSTLAQSLANHFDATWIRSDAVRKELAGLAPGSSAPADFGEGIYSGEWTERTYEECLRRTGELLFDGRRVIIDASFSAQNWRQRVRELALRLGVPWVLFHCTTDRSVVANRLAGRVGDVSDADWTVYEKALQRWEPIDAELQPNVCELDTSHSANHSYQLALARLQIESLAS